MPGKPEPSRRVVLATTLAAALPGSAAASTTEGKVMYGLIGTFTAQPGSRATLARILASGITGMPGCLSYIVAEDPTDLDKLWITEVWESREAHAASLSLPSVQAAIREGRPLIAGMARVAETVPVAGTGVAGQ